MLKQDILKSKAQKLIQNAYTGVGKTELDKKLTELVESLLAEQTSLKNAKTTSEARAKSLSEHCLHYQFLFDNLPASAFVLNDKGEVTEINDTGMQFIGYKHPQDVRKHPLKRVLQSQADIQWLNTVSLQGKPYQSFSRETRLTKVNGSKADVIMQVVVLPENDILAGKVMVALVDLSAQYALDHKSGLLSSLMNNTKFFVFVLNKEHKILFANKAFADFYGIDIEDTNDLCITELLNEASFSRLHSRHEQIFVNGESIDYQYSTFDEKENITRYYSTNVFPIRFPDGKQFGAGFITQEVTDKVQTEERLQTAAEIFKEGGEGIIITDKDLKIISVNSAFTEITGFKEQDVLSLRPYFFEQFFGEQLSDYQTILDEIDSLGRWMGEIESSRANGSPLPLWISVSRTPKKGSEVKNYVIVFSDITEKLASQKEIEKLAYYDPLTNIPNRRLLQDRVDQLVTSADREKQEFILAFIDLDHFKEINDLHGHDIGDRLLKLVSERLLKSIRKGDTLCRLGGDEFVLLMPNTARIKVEKKLEEILQILQQPFTVKDYRLNLSASIGVVSYPENGKTYQELLQHADTAMYEAKARGKNCFRFFEAALLDRLKKRFAINSALRPALHNDEFYLHYQPKVNLLSNKIVGCEALIRWRSKELGNLMPRSFIPIAEENGFIKEIGEWTFKRVLDEAKEIQALVKDNFNISINLSASQFREKSLISYVKKRLANTKLDKIKLEFEITERTAMHQPANSKKILTALRGLGISISLDDFGTGYSSLSYLKHLPLDIIKIDRSFVTDVYKSADNAVICTAIINLAHSLGLQTVAEGVELDEHKTFLLENKCNLAQGYGLYRPMTLDKLLKLLEPVEDAS